MEAYKKQNLSFEVVYEDGTRKKVSNGILFEEAEDSTMHVHIGTDNQFNLLFAILNATGEMLGKITKGKVRVSVKKTVKNSDDLERSDKA